MTIPLFLPPGAGRSVRIRDTKKTTFKITGETTDGNFGLFEHEMAPATGGASAHVHKKTTEIFYVVRGEVEFVVGGRKEIGGAGTCVFVPENVPHGFGNVGDEAATLLIMFYPMNSREKYFEALAELTKDGRSPSLEELVALMERYDQYLV